jgi:protein OS-9
MSALAVALLQFAAVRAAGQGGDKASEAAAAAISSTIQPLGPQYTVNVRPATTARVKDLSISGTNLVSTMDSNGRPYLCELPPSAAEAEAAKAEAKAEAKAKAAGDAAAAPASAAAAGADKSNPGGADTATLVTNVITALRNHCVTKKTGWWTYELCHFGDLKQYHEEGGKIDAVQNWKLGIVQPPSQLGAFTPAASTVTNGVTLHTRAKVAHPFVNGKICDETKKPRAGEVHYECRGSASATSRPAIIEILEPSTCFYHISVHVPGLCAIPEFKPPASAMPDSSDSPAAVARLYRERCFYRSEGWWTYEFCVNKHVRQFRQQPGKNAAPGAADPDSPEFYLGHVGAAVRSKLPYEPKLHSKDPRRSYAFASYTGGSGCDLVDQKRETEVRISCATDSQDRIVSVQEVALCQYRLVFASAKMCALEEFSAAEEKVKEIVCYYADDEEAAEVEAAEAEAEVEAAAAAAEKKKAKPPPPPAPRPAPPPPRPPPPPPAKAAAAKAAAAGGAAKGTDVAEDDCATVMQRACGTHRGKGGACNKCLAQHSPALNAAGCKAAVLKQYCEKTPTTTPSAADKSAAAKAKAAGEAVADKNKAGQTTKKAPTPAAAAAAAKEKAKDVAPHDPVAKEKQERAAIQGMNVTRIKAELITRGLDITGLKDKKDLVDRLVEARVEGVQAFLPGGGTPARYEPPVETRRHMSVSGEQVAKLIGKLANTCSKTNMGWWTFQICHLDEVTQWHEDNGIIQKDASWSLGYIEMPEDMGLFKVHETTGTGGLVQHQFDGGQLCHEIDKPRSGEYCTASPPIIAARYAILCYALCFAASLRAICHGLISDCSERAVLIGVFMPPAAAAAAAGQVSCTTCATQRRKRRRSSRARKLQQRCTRPRS